MSIRHAKPSDIEDISWIAVNATPLDPVCTYRFPYRDRFPEDFQKFTRTRMIDYLTTGLKGDSDFLVYENPDGSDTGHGIIAYAVWDLPPGHSEPRTLPEVAEETSQDRKEENEIIGSEGSSAVPVDDASMSLSQPLSSALHPLAVVPSIFSYLKTQSLVKITVRHLAHETLVNCLPLCCELHFHHMSFF